MTKYYKDECIYLKKDSKYITTIIDHENPDLITITRDGIKHYNVPDNKNLIEITEKEFQLKLSETISKLL